MNRFNTIILRDLGHHAQVLRRPPAGKRTTMYQECATGPMDSLRANRTSLSAEFPRPEERPWGTGSPYSFAFTADDNSIRRFSEMASRPPVPVHRHQLRPPCARRLNLSGVAAVRGSESTKATVAPLSIWPGGRENMFAVLTAASIPGVLNEGNRHSSLRKRYANGVRSGSDGRWLAKPFRIAPSPIGRFQVLLDFCVSPP